MLGWFKKKFKGKQTDTDTPIPDPDVEELSNSALSSDNIPTEDPQQDSSQPPITAEPEEEESSTTDTEILQPAADIDDKEELIETVSVDKSMQPTVQEPAVEPVPDEAAEAEKDVLVVDTPEAEIQEINIPEDPPDHELHSEKKAQSQEDEPVEQKEVEQEIEEPSPPEESSPILKQEAPKKTFFTRLSNKLTRTRESFTYQLDTLFLGKKEIDGELLDDLEELLITADLGVSTTEELLDYARRRVRRKELSDPNSLKTLLKEKITSFIAEYQQDAELVMPKKGPFVIMVIGVNGVGKTTTIGKVAYKFRQSDQSVLLVAADTFRAAAVSQLKIWGERNDVPVYSQAEGTDPSSVVFDAIAHARAKNFDVVLVDTAGRLHTQDNLMAELKKIKRVMHKQLPGSPHEVMLVLDATTGQNGISQAKLFDAAVDITGIALTKLDGTAKGGIVANICRELKTPIRFIGIGEQLEDLRDFDSDEFIEALFQNASNTN